MSFPDLTNNYQNYSFSGTSNISGTNSPSQLTGVLSNMVEGNIFEGTVNSIEDGKVLLSLTNGQSLLARLDSGISLGVGQSVFFQVKSNDGATIQIKPFSLQNISNPTIINALDAAGIGVNEKSVSMVNLMMNEKMPIDVESLLNINRDMVMNPQTDVNTIVMLNKLQIPVTKENLSSYEVFSQNNAQISSDVDILLNSITDLTSNKNLDLNKLLQVNTSIMDVFAVDENADLALINDGEIISKEEVNVPQNGTMPTEGEEAKETISSQSNNIQNQDVKPEVKTSLESNISIKDILSANELASIEKQLVSLKDGLPDFDKLLGLEGKLNSKIESKEFLRTLSSIIKDNTDGLDETSIKRLLSGDAYKKILSSVIKDSWALDSKDITNPKALKDTFEKIIRQNNDLMKIANRDQEPGLESFKNATTTIKNNISFMNQVNELYTFVQVPVKMMDLNKKGDLLIYQNKKGKYEPGDELSAFLHFDFEHLGTTDVAVKLKEKNVKCQWFLQDEAALNIIEKNIGILSERLKKKGYNISIETSVASDETENLENVFNQSNKASSDNLSTGMIRRYSFDVRA